MRGWPFDLFGDKDPRVRIVRKVLRCPDCETTLTFLRAVTVEVPNQRAEEENHRCQSCGLEITIRRTRCSKG